MAPAPSFRRSAARVVQYLYDRAGLGLDGELVLDLFDDPAGAGEQLARIRDTLDKRLRERREDGRPITDVLVYYIGHGTTDDQNHLSLLVQRSSQGLEAETGIKAYDLARTLRLAAPQQRRLVILDCCFSEFAARDFMGMSGTLDQAVAATAGKDFDDDQPTRGTLLLCSSPVGQVSIGAPRAEATLFTGAVLDVLQQGAEGRSPYLSFSDLRDLVFDRMLESYGANAPRPALHQPNQMRGDLTRVPAFPNRAAARLAEEKRKADEAAHLAEEKRKADEAAHLAEEKRKADEAARLLEETRKADEAARLAEEKRKADEAARLAEEKRKADEAARLAEEKRKADEAARLAEEKRRADEAARLAEEKRKADEAARLAEEKRKADEVARLAEEKRKADEAARLAEEKRKADEVARLAEEKRKAVEVARLAEEKRKADEAARLAEEKRKADEAARLAEEKRKADEVARLAEEKRQAAEAARLAEEKRKADEAARLAEEKRKADEVARLAKEKRKAVEAARLTERKRKADELARLASEKRKVEEAGGKQRPLAMVAAAAVGSLILAGGGAWWLFQTPPGRSPTPLVAASSEIPSPSPLPAADTQPQQAIAPNTPPSVPPDQTPQPDPQAPRQVDQPPAADKAPSAQAAPVSTSLPGPELANAPAGSPPRAETAEPGPDGVPDASPVTRQPNEALVVPPRVAVPHSPSSSDSVLSPIQRWLATAQALPCSALNIASSADGVHLWGIATAGKELDRLLADLPFAGRLTDDITRVDRFACAPITALAALEKRSAEISQPAFTIQVDNTQVAIGARLGIDVITALSNAYVDIYQSDGLVRHVLRPALSGAATKPHVNWKAMSPAGPGLVVAIGSATPLDLGVRAETEKAADYLVVLQARLESAAVPPAADFKVVTVVRPAEPKIESKAGQRPEKTQPAAAPCRIGQLNGWDTAAGAFETIRVVNTGGGCVTRLSTRSQPAQHIISVSKAPRHGSVGVEGNAFYYTPSPGYAGSDDFEIGMTPLGHIKAVVTVLPPGSVSVP